MLNAAQNIKSKSVDLPLKSLLAAGLLYAISVGAQASATTTPQDETEQRSVDHYQQSVEQLEAQYGPYHEALSQELTSLGQHYRQQGQLDESRDILQRAMHVSRINSGLYNLQQAAILEQLVNTNSARQDWKSVDANQHYLFWLHQRNFQADDPRMLPVLNKLGRWHLNAYDNHTHKGKVEHLLRAHSYYKQAIDIVSKEHGELAPQLLEHLQGYTATNYFLASHQVIIHQETEDLGGARATNITNEEKRRLLQYIQNSYRNGKNSIDQTIRIQNSNDRSSIQDKVTAELAMADWNLLFGRWHTALTLYKNIYTSLNQTLPDKLSADDFFASPVPLPQLPALEDTTADKPSSHSYILVAFDVSPRGSARNIEFVEEFPESDTQNRIRVRRALKTSKFRPRMQQGEPVATQRHTQKFVFPAAIR